MQDKKRFVAVALCEGRHEMPAEVQGVIFGNQLNPLDVVGLEKEAYAYLSDLAKETEHLHIYVTGLTVALIAALNIATQMFQDVVLFHYDRESGSYYPQGVRVIFPYNKTNKNRG